MYFRFSIVNAIHFEGRTWQTSNVNGQIQNAKSY